MITGFEQLCPSGSRQESESPWIIQNGEALLKGPYRVRGLNKGESMGSETRNQLQEAISGDEEQGDDAALPRC